MSAGPLFVPASTCGPLESCVGLSGDSICVDQQSTLASSSFDSTESSNASYDGSFPITVAPPSTTRWREHSDMSSADSPPNGTNSGDPHESRPMKRLHSASGSLEGNLPEVIVPITSSKSSRKSSTDDQTTTVSTMSITKDQLFLVQRHFPDAVVQKVQAPELVGMSRRQRERALSEYRNQLKEYQLVFMGFDEQAVRQALKDTHRKDTRTEQHVQDAAHKLNMEQLVNLLQRAFIEPCRKDAHADSVDASAKCIATDEFIS